MALRTVCALILALAGTAAAQTAAIGSHPAPQPFDLNVYPALTGSSGIYDLNVASTQKGPPGTIAVTSSAPPEAYSFQDILRNTHGYVSTGVSTGNGHFFEGGVSIPIVPGKAELELAGSTGQMPSYKVSNIGKLPAVTYDAYNIGLALHPADDVEAYIGFTEVRLHSSGLGTSPFGFAGPNAFAIP